MDYSSLRIGLLLFPKLTQLDLTGPLEVFARVPGWTVELIWKDCEPVASDRGFQLLPTTSFADCPQLDVLCVPGGPGQIALMDDKDTLDFIRHRAKDCRLITSVCTGSLVLGAAGLLRGYRATCHWASHDQLALLGAIPVQERAVRDRNRITGAGVTSGIDFALTLVAELAGSRIAQEIQLQMEYDPDPPFASGSPHKVTDEIKSAVQTKMEGMLSLRRTATEQAAARLQTGRMDDEHFQRRNLTRKSR